MSNLGARAAENREILFPLPAWMGTCWLLPGFLDAAECADLIARAEARGFQAAAGDYPPSYRDNDRQVLDSPALAARLYQRLRRRLSGSNLPVDAIDKARMAGINPRLRHCRYRAGQRFNLHQDGVHHGEGGLRSHLTFMIYLSAPTEFEGGETLFFDHGPERLGHAPSPTQAIVRLRPAAGSLIVFSHDIWHAGAELHGGVKHILRSDLMHAGDIADDDSHRGYIWTLAALRAGGIASGGRDCAIRLWDAGGQRTRVLRGHAQSVLGLAETRPGTLVSSSRDRSLRWWDTHSGQCIGHHEHAHAAAALCVVADGAGGCYNAGADHAIRHWDQRGHALARWCGHRGWIWALCRMDGMLLSASEDGDARLWNPLRQQSMATLAHPRPLRAIAANPSGIVCGDMDGWATFWTRGKGGWRPRQRLRLHRAAIRSLALLADGGLLSTGEDHCVQWLPPGHEHPHLLHRHDNFATCAVLASNRVVSASYDGRLHYASLPALGTPAVGGIIKEF